MLKFIKGKLHVGCLKMNHTHINSFDKLLVKKHFENFKNSIMNHINLKPEKKLKLHHKIWLANRINKRPFVYEKLPIFSFLLPLFFFVCLSFNSIAQSISGKVTGSDGPLTGVSVFVEGTDKGTLTDIDGKYMLEKIKTDDIIVFSFISLKTQKITVGSQTVIDVVMVGDTAQLNEVVVVGYGTVTKKDATGAVDSIGSESFDQISSSSPAQLLRGKVAGVQITQSSGEPGAGLAIRIRGNTSIRAGNQPLIVVDGVPLDGGNISSGINEGSGGGANASGSPSNIAGNGSPRNPLNFINQNDIESINVLKDASSTAIYGSRGANGVIVITTKKGRTGSNRTQISYSPSVTMSNFSAGGSFSDVMDASAFKAAGGAINETGNYNWKDTILRTAFTHNHDLTMSTSSENSSTRLSFGVSQQQGIVKKTGLDKYTLSFTNSTGLFNKVVILDTRVLYSRLNDQSHLLTSTAGFEGNLIASALYWRPTYATIGGDDADKNNGYTFISNTFLNPQQLLDSYDDNAHTNKFLASVNATINITDKLKYKFLLGLDNSTSVRGLQILPTMKILGVAQNESKFGQASIYNDQRFNVTAEHTLNYKNQFNPDMLLDVLVGFSYYSYLSNGYQTHAEGFDEKQTNLIDNIEGAGKITGGYLANSYKNQSEIQSYFARGVFTYQKFLATVTVRADGSSKFGSDNKYGVFPSLGLGYKIFEDQQGILNDFKFRVNWGILGNQEFASNSALAKISYNNLSLNTDTNANTELKWETTTSYGAGFDFVLVDNKLSGSIDYFMKNTADLIFALPSTATQPGPGVSRYVNLDGTLKNQGFEIGLNYTILSNQDWVWTVNGNASFLSNTLENFPLFLPSGGLNGQGLTGAYSQVLSNNKPLYSYYLFEFKEYDENGNSLYAQADGSSGALGTASKGFVDKTALPTTNVGFSTTVEYKNFDFSTSFYGSFGHYIYNNTKNALYFKSAFPTRNISSETQASVQSSSDPNTPSTKYLESGNFLRWSSLSLGYKFKNDILDKIGASSGRIYFNISNLYIITNYSGFDPEVDTNKALNGVPSAGIDHLSYPRDRGFTLGLNITF